MMDEAAIRKLIDDVSVYIEWKEERQHGKTADTDRSFRKALSHVVGADIHCGEPSCTIDHKAAIEDEVRNYGSMANLIRKERSARAN